MMANSQAEVVAELKALLEKEEEAGYGKINNPCDYGEVVKVLYNVVEDYSLPGQTVALAINYCDRCSMMWVNIKDRGVIPKHQFNLLIIASMLIAIKLKAPAVHDSHSESLIRELCLLPPGDPFEPRDVVSMEKQIFDFFLKWRLNAPTMHEFVAHYCEFHPLTRNVDILESYLYEMSCYLCELAMFFLELISQYKPSIIAHAAILVVERKCVQGYVQDDGSMDEDLFELPSSLNVNPHQEVRVAQEAMFVMEKSLKDEIRQMSPPPIPQQQQENMGGPVMIQP